MRVCVLNRVPCLPADIIVVNKADGGMESAAKALAQQHAQAGDRHKHIHIHKHAYKHGQRDVVVSLLAWCTLAWCTLAIRATCRCACCSCGSSAADWRRLLYCTYLAIHYMLTGSLLDCSSLH